MQNEVITYNTDNFNGEASGSDLYENRREISRVLNGVNGSYVTICVLAHNRVEKTKECIESILRYTKGIDYDLLLLDSGSDDGTLDYFKSVEHPKKTIIHLTKNVNYAMSFFLTGCKDFGQYACFVTNDIIVTKDWLKNLLTCIKSDPKNGMVVPVCNNVSNLQDVELGYKNLTEMQRLAAEFNVSDPRKWHRRMRIMNAVMLIRREVLLAKGAPLQDAGFFHNFSDDDITFTVRRMGYNAVLTYDTFVCHNHKTHEMNQEEKKKYDQNMELGRRNFRQKYFGIDAWDDVNNYIYPYLEELPPPQNSADVNILGVDVSCGQPLLDIDNKLRGFDIFNARLSAFTQDAKYWLDLKTICDGEVVCAPIESMPLNLPQGAFDYVVCDKPINTYGNPQKVVSQLFNVCKKGGIVVCKLYNAYTYAEFLNSTGIRGITPKQFSHNIPMEYFVENLEKLGEVVQTQAVLPETGIPYADMLNKIISTITPDNYNRNDAVTRMGVTDFLFFVRKN